MKKIFSEADVEQMLKDSAPVLSRRKERPLKTPPEVRAVFDEVMRELCPIVTVKEMKELLLDLLKERAMDGFEMCARLKEKHICLKGHPEKAAIYGILDDLEERGFIKYKMVVVKERELKMYEITDDGRDFLNKHPIAAEISALSCSLLNAPFSAP